MTIFISILIFIFSCILLSYAGHHLVRALSRIADFLGWREFTVSFFLMSAATALPELFVGVSSALRGVPELSFGNIIGQSIIHFTVAIFIVVIIAGGFKVASPVIRSSTWFSGIMAILPVVMIADGVLSRADGILLILSFVLYSMWLFSKKEYFSKDEYKTHMHPHEPLLVRLKSVMRDFLTFIIGVSAILIAAQGIIFSTTSFAGFLGLPLVVVGAIIVGLGTAMPEIYFSAVSARHKHGQMMIGSLLGSTAVSVSMVLGVVAFIHPIIVPDLSPYFISRAFLIIAVLAFILFIYTDRRLTIRESFALMALYLAFIASEIFAAIV